MIAAGKRLAGKIGRMVVGKAFSNGFFLPSFYPSVRMGREAGLASAVCMACRPVVVALVVVEVQGT